MSAYKQKLVGVVKVNGRILREDNDVVYLPFGSEYSILLKNLESRRSLVKIFIDGQEVTKGGLVLNPNSNVELERFIDDLNTGNKFKFIQKTEKIVEHRGDKIDDGMIRIEYRFEKFKPITIGEHHLNTRYYDYEPIGSYWPMYGSANPFIRGFSGLGSCEGNSSVAMATPTYSCNINSNEGITVKGSESNQSFNYVNMNEMEENSFVIVLRLKGYNGEKEVEKPFIVQDKLECSSCGTKSKSNIKYCPECGTFLTR